MDVSSFSRFNINAVTQRKSGGAYSEAITSTETILLLGAGASAPLGLLTMSDFVGRLGTWEDKGPRKGKACKLDKAELALLDYLVEDIHDPGKDLEKILGKLEHLDAVDSLAHLGELGWKYKDLENVAATYGLTSVAVSLRGFILRAILSHYSEVDPNAVIQLYMPLLELFWGFSRNNTVVIFTTNYDPSIDLFCVTQGVRLIKGFNVQGIWEESVYDCFVNSGSERCVVLFNLHGSVLWRQYENGEIVWKYPPPSETYQLPRRLEYHKDWLKYPFTPVIYPGTTKAAVDNPFLCGYDYLFQCLNHAKLLISIGYSFRDYDILVRMKSALKGNENLRILSVNPSDFGEPFLSFLKSKRLYKSDRVIQVPIPFGQGQNDKLLSILSDAIGKLIKKPG